MRAVPVIVGAGALLALLLVSRRASAADLPPAKTTTGQDGKPLPRGIKNNNPGNLRPGDPWHGLVGVDASNYLIFDTPENGLRALTINLVHQQTRHGLDTVRAIISKWAPLVENPAQPAYIANVSRALGLGPDDGVDLARDRDQVQTFVVAIIRQENGLQPYDDDTLRRGIAAGLKDA